MIDKPPELPGQLAIEPATCLVVVPYVHGREDTVTIAAVMDWGGPYTCQQLSGVLDYAYPDAISEWWSTGLDLVIVNQTAVVEPGIIRELLACPRPWCLRARHRPGLGPRWDLDIVKISAQAMAEHPKLIDVMLEHHAEQGNCLEFDEWDRELYYLLTVAGKAPHVHRLTALAPTDPAPAAGSG
jgi:hypothetical protein